MRSSNAAIIDLSTLNVLFKCDGKFTTALNFGNTLERLGPVLSSLGPGYDIYLCLKPRQAGEGDFVVRELSISAVPFEVDASELFKVLTYFRSCHGVNDIILCNWLNNYVEKARTDTFKSAFYYGNRVAEISVENRLVSSFNVYQSVNAFADVYGDDFDGYGDLGLIDVDGFRAQFPEFSRCTRIAVMTLAPLAHCCTTQVSVSAEEVYERLDSFLHEPQEDPEEPVVEEPVVEEPKPLEEYVPTQEPVVVKHKGKTPIPAILLMVASLFFAIGLGVTFSRVQNGAIVDKSEDYYSNLDARVVGLQRVIDVYGDTLTTTFDTVSAYDYVNKSGLDVTIPGFECYPDQFVVRCNCASEDIFENFVSYIEENYTLNSTNDMGITGTDEAPFHQYTVMFSQRGA